LTSYLQRKLSIGYNKAAKLVEMLEEKGVVSHANHVGKREVLVRSVGAELSDSHAHVGGHRREPPITRPDLGARREKAGGNERCIDEADPSPEQPPPLDKLAHLFGFRDRQRRQTVEETQHLAPVPQRSQGDLRDDERVTGNATFLE
jgi:Ftsk gamma domain